MKKAESAPTREAEAALTRVEGGRSTESANGARRRKQEARDPRTVEDHTGSVHDPRATTLRVPEEKRCTALTTRGARCKAPRLRGLAFCMFHGHLAASDETLKGLVVEGEETHLSPRTALAAVARMRSKELAELAVQGAADASGKDGGRSILALVDAVDPLREETTTVKLTPSDVGDLSFAELALAVKALTPSSGSTSQAGATQGEMASPSLPLLEQGSSTAHEGT